MATAAEKRQRIKTACLDKCKAMGLPTAWIAYARMAELHEFLQTGKVPTDNNNNNSKDKTMPNNNNGGAFLVDNSTNEDHVLLRDGGWLPLSQLTAGCNAEQVRAIVRESLKDAPCHRIEIHNLDTRETVKLDRQHYKFEALLRSLNAGLHVCLAGPAGTGKSHAAQSAAHALGIPYVLQSFAADQTSDSLVGYKNVNGEYVSTLFRQAYEFGGLILLDEIDTAQPSVMTCLNAALANGHCAFPDAIIEKHADFRCVVGCNMPRGGDDMYDRTGLDAAQLDRLVLIAWDYDWSLAASLVGAKCTDQKFDIGKGGIWTAQEWFDYVRNMARGVDKTGAKMVAGMRAIQQGMALFAVGFGAEHVKEMALWKGIDADTRRRVEAAM